jgi:hypothetical protein
MLLLFRSMWIGWNGVARRLITAQSFVLMVVTFVIGIGPVALLLRLVRRSMIDRAPADPAASTYRVVRDPAALDMKAASRQF